MLSVGIFFVSNSYLVPMKVSQKVKNGWTNKLIERKGEKTGEGGWRKRRRDNGGKEDEEDKGDEEDVGDKGDKGDEEDEGRGRLGR